MNVANVVDQQAKVERVSKVPRHALVRVSLILHELFLHRGLGLKKTYNGPGDVECFRQHSGVEVVKEGLVDVVPG